MNITIEGTEYEFDAGKMMLSELFMIQEKTGLKFAQWQRGLQEMDPAALKSLVYLLKVRAGEQPDYETLDFNISSMTTDDEVVLADPTGADVSSLVSETATSAS